MVAADALRFDFTHPHPLTPQQLEAVEADVNRQIDEDAAVQTQLLSRADAEAAGAVRLLGESYPELVRVVRVGSAAAPLSLELCGGTHAHRTAQLRLFKITSESSVSAGVRRIEAVASHAALRYVDRQLRVLAQLCSTLRAQPSEALDQLHRLRDHAKQLQKELQKAQMRIVELESATLSAPAGSPANNSAVASVDGRAIHVAELPPRSAKEDAAMLRSRCDLLRKSDPLSIHVLVCGERVLCTAAVEHERNRGVNCVQLLRQLPNVSAGGRAHLAEGKLPAERVGDVEWLKSQLRTLKVVAS